MSCSNPNRQARAIAISEYIWAHAAVERGRGVNAKGKQAVQSASKKLASTMRTFQHAIVNKCLPKSRKARAKAGPRYAASGPDLF
jgi:hypothetical protein